MPTGSGRSFKETGGSFAGLRFRDWFHIHGGPVRKKLAMDVYRTILRKKNLFLQAPTGTGKTLSTVYPAVKAVGNRAGGADFLCDGQDDHPDRRRRGIFCPAREWTSFKDADADSQGKGLPVRGDGMQSGCLPACKRAF